jgi:tRNA pseudouridine13 synthase
MRIKQRPEDFSVTESYRFCKHPTGRYRVYLMDKQKLSTFDAVEIVRERFGLKPGAISYCGLKDKQGRTEQIIAVESADVEMQEPNLRLKFLGRTNQPLSAQNTTSNRFSVTTRGLTSQEMEVLNQNATEIKEIGLINYFDSQRFGSIKHGQGYIAKDLIRGDFETALRNYMAKPSKLDKSDDAKVKQFWAENWGKFDAYCPYKANKKYARILFSLRTAPKDFARAFMQINSDYRAMLLFTYQSYLWNEGARRLLQRMFAREDLSVIPYQAGSLLFHKRATPEQIETLKQLNFPLLSPQSTFSNPQVEEAVAWVLGKEKIKLEDLKIPQVKGKLFFKHEERPLLVFPYKLVVGKVREDELNPPSKKINVAFTLKPGSYATLLIKRLFLQ